MAAGWERADMLGVILGGALAGLAQRAFALFLAAVAAYMVAQNI